VAKRLLVYYPTEGAYLLGICVMAQKFWPGCKIGTVGEGLLIFEGEEEVELPMTVEECEQGLRDELFGDNPRVAKEVEPEKELAGV
jgi:hypothetical protein